MKKTRAIRRRLTVVRTTSLRTPLSHANQLAEGAITRHREAAEKGYPLPQAEVRRQGMIPRVESLLYSSLYLLAFNPNPCIWHLAFTFLALVATTT